MMAYKMLGALVLALWTVPASAQTLDQEMTTEAGWSSNEVHYECADKSAFSVNYMQKGPNDLAIVPIGGETFYMAGVIAASGVKYVAGPYVWWVKAGEASLTDEMGKTPEMLCKANEP